MKSHPYLSESISKVIEKIRNEKEMSKSALADFADIQRSYLLEIIKGKKKPTVNTIFSICEAVQMDPVEFFRMVVEEMERRKR